ncbi:MAG: YbbR-like domain-containing protein [Desulfovibrio desulfuricans]|nr:YbbR-like domain-containing protein [Desulfovibrio desulfuricans]
MKSSDSYRRPPHLLSMLLALVIAVGMWYMVSVRDRLEVQIDVNLDYIGIPSNLIVTDGLINKVTVRLRGPETLLRSVTQRNLSQAVDLSSIKKGTTVVPLAAEHLDARLRAFELIDVQPPRIVVKADNVMERSVPIRAVVESPLRNGALTVENVSVTPAAVLLRGPERIISEITGVPLVIMLDPKAAGSTVRRTIALDTPSLVTPVPASVKVQYTITSGRTVVTRRCKVEFAGGPRRQYELVPQEIDVMVEVPEALAKNSRYLNEMEVSVALPDIPPGESAKTPLHFKLPEGMTLLNPLAEEVTVIHRKK